MTEKLLQFIWQFGYFNNAGLATTDGEPVTIIFPGTINQNSGPDFSAARIRIGNTTFFGHVELHLKTSDWEKHHHQQDANYSNVVLHVVFEHDKSLAHAIPVLELEPRISGLLLARYQSLLNAASFIPCGTSVSTVKELVWLSWKERLLVERLTRKATQILSLLQESNNSWEETCWWIISRNFGMPVNGEAFEAIAKTIPVSVLARHKSSIHQLEALLFGQAGLLQETFNEDYPLLLQREYRFLQKKLTLKPAPFPLQFLRMRPSSFPTVRLAQLAVLVQQSTHLFSTVVQAKSVADIRAVFDVTANDYWHYHYTFGQVSAFKKKTVGQDTMDLITVNAIIPLVFAYGIYHSDESYRNKAVRWLDEMKAEKNNIIKGFSQLGIHSKTAFDSQALLQLKKDYCDQRKCLQCTIGNSLLKREALHLVPGRTPSSR